MQMVKRIYILLIALLGFVLTPSIAFACGSGKSCCENKSKAHGKSACCKKDKQPTEQKDDCNGKCGNAACHCPSLNLTLPVSSEIGYYSFNFPKEKQNFYHVETRLSSGFYAIWSPPNIG